MSRNGLWIAGVALLVAIGALVLQFALPSSGGSADVSSLQAQIDALQRQGAGGANRIAYVNAENAFNVFLSAVSDLRQRALDKQAEIVELQQAYSESTISPEEYQQQGVELQVELLDAQVAISLGTVAKMLESSHFADLRSELEQLSDMIDTVADGVKNLLSTARIGIIDAADFQSRYEQMKTGFTQVDTLLTQAASTKIVQAASALANEYGYDLVLVKKDVVIYSNPATVTDITELVKSEISTYL